MNRPPRIAEILLSWCLPKDMREDVLGDLQERYQERFAGDESKRFKTGLWYWLQTVRMAWGCLPERLNPSSGLTGIGGEIKSSCRTLLRRPALTALVVLTLGLGIGANVAIFSFVYTILLRPLPFRDADRLLQIGSERGGESGLVSIGEVYEMREHLAEWIEDIAAFRGGFAYNVSADDAPEEIPATLCTSNLFEVLGTPVLHGAAWPRAFDRERGDAVLLHHGFWRRRFGGDPRVAGQKITLDADPRYQIHGVLPPEVDFPFRADVYRSLILRPQQVTDRQFRGVLGIARMRPGASLPQVTEAIDALARRLAADYPESNEGYRFRAIPLRDVYAGAVRPYLLLLMTAVALVLLIACANVVNILLVRASTLHSETAVRRALGASRARLARQRLVESLLLAVLGGALGVALSIWSVRILSSMVGNQLPSWISVQVDSAAIGFSVVLALVCGIGAGVAPALTSSRSDLGARMGSGSRGSAGPGATRFRSSLVAGQVALATVLLIGAGLVVRSFHRLQQADLGYDPASILTFRVALPYGKYGPDGPNTEAFYRQLLDEISALPGVEAAAVNHNLPMSNSLDDEFTPVVVEGQSVSEERSNPYVLLQRISPDYFRLMSIPLLRGRTFDSRDQHGSLPVAIVSERMARRFWPRADPLGKRLRIASRSVWAGVNESDIWMTVIGVVDNVIHKEFSGDSGLAFYVPFTQMRGRNQYVLAKGSIPPQSFIPAATRAVWAVDPQQSNFDILTMQERVDARIWRQRVARTIFTWFAGLAAVLCAVGIYGVVSYAVGSRTREIGIRAALGAGKASLVKGVAREASLATLAGLAVGLAFGFGGTRLMHGLLYEVTPTDPLVFAAAPLALAAAAVVGALVPAWRAARIDPMVALRHE